ncbi:MAG: Tol-Pal system protein TolB [Chlamydiales bacterium]|nr:Tol-Pal system protein TolB [Chlamydiales bacterium]MCH9635666.1 Tol-Pal system protein TolB [Chlamydiales bacterium]MCH9703563.1 Tol-Pal system protein TolB [Chlamydiota bacterium]
MLRFLLLLALPLFATDDIVVQVKSQNHVAPLYLAPISIQGSGFASSYCRQLERILEFDFQHNGRTNLVSNSLERELLSQKGVYEAKRWRDLGVDFYIQPIVDDKRFTLTALDVRSGRVQKLSEVLLSGNLARDRQQLHQAADAVFLSLFGQNGIASKRILYTLRTKLSSDSQDWVTEVWEADYDFANQKKLTSDQQLCVTPSYVPGTKNYLYVSYKIGQPKIFLASTKSGEGRRLTFLRGNQLMPTVSAQNDRIAFISDVTGNPDLFVQKFSVQSGVLGKPQQIFHAAGAAQGSPTFSPDGQSIAFVSNKDGTARIYMMPIPDPGAQLSDLKPQMISKKNRGNTSPAWSPDGSKIAFSALTAGVRQIWIYDLKSGLEWQLTKGQSHKENPVWAPNSLHLLFNTQSKGAAELYLINLNQKEATKISSGGDEKRFPAW